MAILVMAYFVEYRQTFQKVEIQENQFFVTNYLNSLVFSDKKIIRDFCLSWPRKFSHKGFFWGH